MLPGHPFFPREIKVQDLRKLIRKIEIFGFRPQTSALAEASFSIEHKITSELRQFLRDGPPDQAMLRPTTFACGLPVVRGGQLRLLLDRNIRKRAI